MLARLKKYRIFSKLLALAAAVILWFVVMSIINPDLEVSFSDVKVTFNGKTELYNNKGYTILSDTDMEMDVVLLGKRNDVLELSKADIELICDVSQISGDGENRIMCSVNTPKGDSVTVVNRTELIATVRVDEIVERKIDIRVETSGTLAENLRVGTITLSTDSAVVRGPAMEVAEITHAVVTVPLYGIENSMTQTLDVTLFNAADEVVQSQYVQLITKTVDVEVPVQMIKELPLRITLNNGGGLTENEVETLITPSKITVIGERSAVEEVEYLSLGMIDLDGIGDGLTTERDFMLPSGLSCMSDRSSATITVTVKDIIVKTFELTNINFIPGLSNDIYDFTPVDTHVTVRLRGNATLLNTITASDFTAIVMVSELDPTEEGILLAPVQVLFKPAVNAVLTEKEYTMVLSVTEIVPDEPVTPIDPDDPNNPDDPNQPDPAALTPEEQERLDNKFHGIG